MKKEELKKINDRYLKGISSLREEKYLKDTDDLFFKALKEEKETRMDLSFDDFLAQVPTEKKMVKIVNRIGFRISVAAALLAVIGGLLYWSESGERAQPSTFRTAYKQQSQSPHIALIEPTEVAGIKKESEVKTVVPKKHFRQKNTSAQKSDDSPVLESGEYREDYVVLNGQPVGDEEEAVALTLKSLGLLANNLENGVDKVKNIKQMSITIN